MPDEIFVTRPSMPDLEEYIKEIRPIWDSRILTNVGQKHREFQAGLREYLSVENIELLTNGHMALELSMQAFNLTGEVITAPFTFISTTQAIVRCGLEPVFCDVNPVDLTMDASKIEGLITKRTSAIVPVHVYGSICDVEEIERIAKKHGLKVIYDAAHAFGVRLNDKGIGSFGDASVFSFHATKVFNTIEGGAVCFKDPLFGEKLHRMKNFGIKDETKITEIGANAKMNEFCAAMGLCNLRHADREIQLRRAVSERYRQNLSDLRGIYFLPEHVGVRHNYAYMPAVFDEAVFGASRDDVFGALALEGIYARRYFYPLTSESDCYNGRFDANKTPVALKKSRQVLSLPMYADLTLTEVDRICAVIRGCKK